MASLEKRPQGGYRIVFRYAGQKYSRSLKTKSKRAADAVLSRLEDNLYRAELGTFQVPDGADVASVLLSDGTVTKKKSVPEIRTLQTLLDSFLVNIPCDSIEPGTQKMLQIHARHLIRILSPSLRIQTLGFEDLQRFVDKRSKEKGRRGKPVSAVTIKKEITTLSAAWKWATKSNHVTHPMPKDDLRYPKKTDKPPFQTYVQIQRKIDRGGLNESEQGELWDSLFLTATEISEALAHVEKSALHRFIFPMIATAAHTGARRSELLRSEIDDFDFSTNCMVIREKKRVKGTFSMRTVPISPFLKNVLRSWFERHPGGRFSFCFDAKSGSTKDRSTFQGLTPDEAQHHLNTTFKGSKWSIVAGWHVFRHSFCSNCAAVGIDQRLINAWVGHQTEEMVRRYRHLIPDQQPKAIAEVFPSA